MTCILRTALHGGQVVVPMHVFNGNDPTTCDPQLRLTSGVLRCAQKQQCRPFMVALIQWHLAISISQASRACTLVYSAYGLQLRRTSFAGFKTGRCAPVLEGFCQHSLCTVNLTFSASSRPCPIPTTNRKMSSFTPPPDGDQNRATELIVICWIEFIIALAFVAARFYSRIRITRNVWWDDWWILITLVSSDGDEAPKRSRLRACV